LKKAILLTALALCSLLFMSKVQASQVTAETLKKMPLSFTKNMGQWDSQVLFRANAGGATMWFTKEGVTYQFTRRINTRSGAVIVPCRANAVRPNDPADRFSQEKDSVEQLVLTAKFVGANPNPEVIAERQLEYKCNYFLGNDPTKWHTDVPNYEAITLKDIYPGIDLKYSGDGSGQAAYEFITAPGADIAQIKVEYEGAEETSIDADGKLILKTKWGDMTAAVKTPVDSPRPVGEGSGVRAVLSGTASFSQLSEKTIGFEASGSGQQVLGTLAVGLVYSTYLGGGSDDYGYGIAVDGSGNAYVTGSTWNFFPTLNPYQTHQGNGDAFVTKFSSAGNSLIYSTYLGGGINETGMGIAVDGSGNAYVTGITNSSNFPTLNPYQTYQGPVPYGDDVFVTELSCAGNSLIYSTYLGGAGYDEGYGIAVDGSGNAYLTGWTSSTNFPTQNPYQLTIHGSRDVFVTKLSTTGNSLIYSTYLGGSSYDEGYGIAVDGSGNAYVAGSTYSFDFPTVNPYQSVHQDGGYTDAFCSKLSSSGNSLIYSTYLGGSGVDEGIAIAVDGSDNVYVTGFTGSLDFPTVDPFQATFQGGYVDAFVTKLSSSGNSLIYSTYLGGGDEDQANDIEVDVSGNAYVTGWTWSPNFPTLNPYQTNQDTTDVFVTKLSSIGNSLIYSTYLGGEGFDEGRGIAIDGSGNAYVTGTTESSHFPTHNPYQLTHQGGHYDAFVTKLSGGAAPPHISLGPLSLAFSAAQGGSLPNSQTFALSNTGGDTLNWSVSDDASWLDVGPVTGNSNSQVITVSVNTTNLTTATYNAITTVSSINADNSPVQIPVEYVVSEASIADLFVSTNDIQLLPENPYFGQDVSVSIKVHNIGQTGAGGFDVQVDGDSAFVSPIADLMIDYLPAGSDTVVQFQWTADASVKMLFVRLDSHNNIPELSENNNIAMKPVNVISPSGLTVTIAPDAIYAELGDTAAYEVTVVNSTTGFHRVALSVSNMGSLPYRFDNDTLELAPGAWTSTKLSVQSGTGCAGFTGTLNFQVQAKAIDNVSLTSTIGAQLVVTANLVLSQFLPASNQTLASNSVTFMWTSRTSSSSTVYYRKVSDSSYSVATGNAGVAHSVIVNNLEYNTDYLWYAKSVSACGTESSSLLRFYTGHGVTFENHSPHFLVKRNYNQKSNLSIVNSDTLPHQVLVEALNPYSDLIVGFTEDGSVDHVVELPPGGSLALNLAIHAQDAQDTNYVMAFRLTSTGHDSSKIYDYASAYITVDWPDTNFVLQDLGFDPQTLVRSMRLLNSGDSISDFAVTVSDAVGIDYFATPQIEHALLGPNQHIDFQLIPTFEDTITLQGQKASCRAVVTATGAGKSVSIQLTKCCQKSIFNVSKPNALVCSDLAAESWYCTNRPVIDVNVSSPRILSGTVTKGILSISFTPKSSVRPHNLTIYLNGHLIETLTNTVPSGTMSFDVNPSFLSVSNSGPVVNHLQLVSTHLNGGHYIVAAEFSLCLCVNNYAEYICASNASDALTILNSRPYLFSGSPSSVEIISPSGGDIHKWTNTPIKVQVTPPHRKYDANVNISYALGGSQSLKLNYDSQQQLYIGELQPQGCGDATITASIGKCGPSLQDNVSVTVIDCDPKRVPVVLVHGWGKGSSPSGWEEMKRWLMEEDDFLYVWTPSISPCGVPGERQFDLNSKALSDAIEAQRDSFQDTNHYRPNAINIIAHSMGGMIARRYAASDDSWSAHSKGVTVNRLIMLGTPNGGVPIAGILSTVTRRNCYFHQEYCALLEAASFALCPGPANAEFAPDKVDAFNRNRTLNTYHSSTRYVGIAGIQGLQLPICLSLLGCPNDGFINTHSVLEAHITLPDGSRPSIVDRAITCPDPSFVPTPTYSTLHSQLPHNRTIYEGLIRPELLETAIPSSTPANNFAMSNTYADTTEISFNDSYLGFIRPFSVVTETLQLAPSSALNILADNFGANMSITLRSPSGVIFDSTDTSGSYTEVEGLISYTIPNPTPGAWFINITAGALADTVSPYFVVAEMEDGIEMTTSISSSFVEARDSVLIFSKLVEAGSPITCASVTCEGFTDSAGLALSLTLRDNGTWPDATANDGIYSAAWIPQDSLGSINILVKSQGNIPQFHRESVLNTFVTSRPTWICGDVDGEGTVNIADVVFLIDYIFMGGAAPQPISLGDVDCSGSINIADVVRLIAYIFSHGAAPCAGCK